ncbi:MAG: hypothetical protein GY718_10190 [Lentisphaerae bacterium]|nr:hypothetical protein [Lentisphaerota bacterium]
MEATVTARKEYECDICGSPIHKGDKYIFLTGRDPRYDEDDNQIGIRFYTTRFCEDTVKCTDIFNEKESNCQWI